MVAQYCKEVKAAVKGDRNYKNSIIKNLEADLEEYLSDHPDATTQDIREYFGAPEDYARELDAAVATSEKELPIKFRRRVMIIVIAAVVAALLIWAVGVFCVAEYVNNDTDGYSTYEIAGGNTK